MKTESKAKAMEKEMSFFDKVRNIQLELKAPKDQFNSFGKYKYRSIESILESIKPLLVKYGLMVKLSDEIVMIGERYYIKATATLTDGSQVEKNTAFAREADKKSGMDEAQITGTASSYARKYALCGLLAIDDNKDADYLNTSKEYTQTPMPNPEDDIFLIIKAEIDSCQSVKALGELWERNDNLQSSKEFVDMVKNRKAVLISQGRQA